MSSSPTVPDLHLVDSLGAEVAADARGLLALALPPEERDDRFESWPGPDEAAGDRAEGRYVGVLATSDGAPVGLVGGEVSDGGIDLDALLAPDAPPELLVAMLDRLAPALADREMARAVVWGRPARPWHERAASVLDLAEHRSLHQMRCRLPVDVEPVPTRDYQPADLEALRSVNNRAFASHPDQGAQTTESLLATMAEPWFRADGVRIYERDGRVAGFCWTKIHPSPPAATELGEIYVIGVDPDFHGQGLGAPMTAAGLDWLHRRGIATGMLYVEGDNVPAIRTYERLGFTVLRTDRAWTWDLTAAWVR